MSFTREQWGAILKAPEDSLSSKVQLSLKVHKPLIEAWVNGEVLECQISENGNWTCTNGNEVRFTFHHQTSFRIAKTYNLSMDLNKSEINYLLSMLEEVNGSTAQRRDVRNSLMKKLESLIS